MIQIEVMFDQGNWRNIATISNNPGSIRRALKGAFERFPTAIKARAVDKNGSIVDISFR